jgi:hypothetical protein
MAAYNDLVKDTQEVVVEEKYRLPAGAQRL